VQVGGAAAGRFCSLVVVGFEVGEAFHDDVQVGEGVGQITFRWTTEK